MKIQSTPLSERPRERCLRSGPASLSLRECLALILGSGPPQLGCMGVANHILDRPGTGLPPAEAERAFFNSLEISGSGYLADIKGLGPAGRAKILAAFELGRRYAQFRSSHPSSETPRQKIALPKSNIPSPRPSDLRIQALAQISFNLRSAPQEWFGFIPLYRNHRLGEFCLVEKGARTHVNLDPAEVFARILALRPQGIILFHNHPSGNLTPSQQDDDLTQSFQVTCHQFRIQLLGHWIVSAHGERWLGVSNKL